MSLNAYRLAGDISHLLSILIVLLRLFVSKTAQGISVRTHELFLLVFITRYLDLVTNFISVYNTVMKIIFLATTAKIVCTIHYDEPIKSTYDKNYDTFPHWKCAVVPVAIISLITHFSQDEFDYVQEDIIRYLWMFSIFLEAVAIVPQLVLLQQSGECDNVTGLYIFFMGAYRALYILNWLYRAQHEHNYRHNWLVFSCGVVQTLVYIVFFSCIFQGNSSLRHKKDDSQPSLAPCSELEEPLLRETSDVGTDAMIDLPELNRHHRAEEETDANIESHKTLLVDNQETLMVV